MSFTESYKNELRREMDKLKGKVIYRSSNNSKQEIKLCLARFSNQNSLSELKFSVSHELEITVSIMMRNINTEDKDIGVRFTLSLPNGKPGFASEVTLLGRSEDASRVRWKEGRSICHWGTRQNILKIQNHREFWYGNEGRLKLADECFNGYAIEYLDGEISVSLTSKDSENNDFYQLTSEIIETDGTSDRPQLAAEEPEAAYLLKENARFVNLSKIAEIHAHAIILKAFDLALYQFRTVKSDFLVRVNDKDESYRTSASKIFPFAIIENAAAVAASAESKVPFLLPSELKEKCKERNLYFSDDLYQAVSVSINSGRHIIFTGPPGCGKSQLAEQVGTLVAEIFNAKKGVDASPKFVTASPSWTSGEVIGRYFPGRDKDSPLEFHPGVFLEAVKNKRCLVIDEINRANMDECFGELFTVLAGQACDLLYQDAIEFSAAEDEELKYGPIKIVPFQREDLIDLPGYCIYLMGEGFRLIGTMNTFDRSALHQMSFALMRRFDMISVSAPSVDNINNIINSKITEMAGNHLKKLPYWGNAESSRDSLSRTLNGTVNNLFGGDQGLVRDGVVGASMVVDVLDFIYRVFNPSDASDGWKVRPGRGNRNPESDMVKSAMAMALIVKLLPQLASAEGQINKVLKKVKNILDSGGFIKFVYTKREEQVEIDLEYVSRTTPYDFFVNEFRAAYAHTHLSVEIEAALQGNSVA